MHVGGEVHYQTLFEQNRRPDDVVWRSSDRAILELDGRTGAAVARETGRAVVYHNSTLFTFTQVHVVRVDQIILNADDVPFVTK